jgi:hypothetical protein
MEIFAAYDWKPFQSCLLFCNQTKKIFSKKKRPLIKYCTRYNKYFPLNKGLSTFFNTFQQTIVNFHIPLITRVFKSKTVYQNLILH